MPRYRRLVSPNSVQHLISRFLYRDFLFDTEGARDEYLRRAALAIARTDWRPLSFALMSSHIHWALEAGEHASERFVKPLHVGFAGWLNRRQQRLGPVFADRHRSVTCEGETAAALLAYLHNNPVRAGVVSDPSHSLWTSHRMYIGLDSAPPWLDVVRGLQLCGFSATPAGRRAFHAFVRARSADPRCQVLSGSGLQELRRSARQEHLTPVELACPTALQEGRGRVLQVPVVRPELCPSRALFAASPMWVLREVAHAEGLTVDALRTRDRTRALSAGRRLILAVWVHQLGRPTTQMAHALGLASSSAAELLGTVSPSQHARAAQHAELLRARFRETENRPPLARAGARRKRGRQLAS